MIKTIEGRLSLSVFDSMVLAFIFLYLISISLANHPKWVSMLLITGLGLAVVIFQNRARDIVVKYDNQGIKEKEIIEYPRTQSKEEVIFHHDGRGRLILKENLNAAQILDSYHLFKYDAHDQLIEENIYGADDRLIRKHIHHYKNGNNTQIEVYVGDTDELLRKIIKTFDRNKNLILLQSEELAMYSSATSYTQKFEYE